MLNEPVLSELVLSIVERVEGAKGLACQKERFFGCASDLSSSKAKE